MARVCPQTTVAASSICSTLFDRENIAVVLLNWLVEIIRCGRGNECKVLMITNSVETSMSASTAHLFGNNSLCWKVTGTNKLQLTVRHTAVNRRRSSFVGRRSPVSRRTLRRSRTRRHHITYYYAVVSRRTSSCHWSVYPAKKSRRCQ